MAWLRILQFIIAVALMAAILMQNRGAGVSGLFGGSGNVYLAKRGLEKTLYRASIILSILFFIISLAIVIL